MKREGSAKQQFMKDLPVSGKRTDRLEQSETKEEQKDTITLESEENYRDLLERANDGICIIQDGVIQYVNTRLAEMWGGSTTGLTGTSFTDYIHPDYLSKTQERYAKRMAGKQVPPVYETVLKNKNGNKIFAQVNGGLIMYNGKPADFVFIHNITRRKKTQQSLRKSEQRYYSLFEQSRDPIYITSRNGKFIEVNQAMLDLFGYTREEIMGINVLKIYINHADRKKFQTKIEKDGFVRDYEIEFRKKDGTKMSCLLTSSIRITENKRILGYQGIIRDITAQKLAEAEIKNSADKLRKSLENTIQAMGTIVEMRDPYTAGHQRRVANLASAMAREMNLSDNEISGLRLSALLHDIGKVRIPVEILSNPDGLSEAEFSMIKMHPLIGYEILKTIEFPWPVAQIVYQHHERMDGSGYPLGLAGEEIIFEARILAVADIVEAIASDRPYRPARGVEEALKEIAEKKNVLYDSKVVDACLNLFIKKKFSF